MDNNVQYTNKNMHPVIDKFSDPLDSSTKYSHVKLVDRVDIEAFIGILYLRAAFRLNIFDREIIWNHESAYNIIGATMSLHRFKFICRLITFDDKEKRNDRWKTDKFASMRELFEDMNERNARMRHPAPSLAIVETFYQYCGHIGFKQYSPNKPAKYGLLYRSLCDSSIPYTYYSLPYTRKPRKLRVQLQSITSPEPTSIPKISSTSCLYTKTFKGSIYPWITTSHQFLWQNGL